MSEHDYIGRFGEAIGLPVPDSDLEALAVDLMTQLERIRTLDQMDPDNEPLRLCFDVRWDD